MQQHQPPRRVPQVVHLGHRLLPAVAALAQVHGRAQPVQLVRDRRAVDLGRGPRAPRLDPQRLEGQGARRRQGAERVEVRARRPATRRSSSSRRGAPGSPRTGSAGHDRPPRVVPDQRNPVALGGRRRQGGRRLAQGSDGGELRRAVEHLDPQHEAHLAQEGEEAGAGSGIHQQPGGLAVVEHARRVFDSAARVEQQGLGRDARRDADEPLRGERIQPAEPVGAGDRRGRRGPRGRRWRGRPPARAARRAGCRSAAAVARRRPARSVKGSTNASPGSVDLAGHRGSLDTREPARCVRAQLLAERRDVPGPEQVRRRPGRRAGSPPRTPSPSPCAPRHPSRGRCAAP